MLVIKKDLKKIKIVFFDFDGVFTDNKVIINEDGKESAICNRCDGIGLSMLRKIGVKMSIVSSESNPIVVHRAKKLKIDCYYDINDKLSTIKQILKKANLQLNDAAFIGNDINDLECLKNVGFPIVVRDAFPAVKKVAKLVLKSKGGNGAVREFCELLYKYKKDKI